MKASPALCTFLLAASAISSVSSGGALIKLEDGSLWEVDPIDRIFTAIWLPVTIIAVDDEGSGPYYRLINIDDGEAVTVKLISQ